ncbi:MAG: DNA polymerase III subunit alpha, partial [Flavobacteriales bacterium]|nr:DNA polymerase III subunit alpha [Flavobacteriales bacterium]
RAARRELGKVFGLPAEEIEQIGGQIRTPHFQPKWENRNYNDPNLSLDHKGRLHQDIPDPRLSTDHLKRLVLKYASYIQGMPSHLSIHACGILIPDKPISYYTSTFMPPKGFPTTQFSMLEAEDIGINKFDILSQRGLGKIKDALTLIEENHPDEPSIDIHDIRRFKQDAEVKKLLRNGDAIGCFYVESPAMRMLMRKLEVDDYLGLVAASSVIRPGVAQSGMMQQYILRKRNPERRKDAHPVMLDLMPETYGVMVYQEDVIKVAHYFAGLSLGEADVLRRGMSGKYRSREEFQRVKEKFFSNCIEQKGYTMELTAEIWRQTESFAGYAFAKGHSASYAVESYQSLFLKAYYPLEYMVATVNNGGGFYTREHYIHEARMHGGIIEAPCVQESLHLTRIRAKMIYLGFHLVKGLDTEVAQRIVSEREMGPYENLADLLDRVPMGMEQLSILIHVGALRNLTSNGKERGKKELLWEAYGILEKKQKRHDEQMRMFRPPTKEYALPYLDHQAVEDAFDEMEYLGFPLCHPFDLLREPVDDHIRLHNLHEYVGQTVTVYGYLVTAKNTKTKLGDRMNFGNFVDRDGTFLDTVHFPEVAARYPFRGKGVYAVRGKVVEEWDFQTIEVESMLRLPYVDDPRYVEAEREEGDKESNRIISEQRKRGREKQAIVK